MNRSLRVGAALFIALALQLWPWHQITRDADTLVWSVLVALVAVASGAGARRLGLGPVAAGAGQVAVVAVVVLAGIGLRFGWRVAAEPLRLADAGVDRIMTGSAPLGAHPGVMLLLTTLVALVSLVAEWMVVAADRPATAALPLLTLYAVVAVSLVTPMLFPEFALFAIGLMLVLGAAAPTGSWGRVATTWGAVAAVTVASLALTWTVAERLPDLEAPDTRAPLQMTDPSLDLKRNLVQGSTDVILRYTTDSGEGTYLKLATLPRFSVDGFGLTDVRVATGRLPAPPGVRGGAGTPRTTSVVVGEFASEWLPAPYAPTSFEADGAWGFALDTLDVMSLAETDRGSATVGLAYTVQSLEVRPDAEALAGAGTSDDPDFATELEVVPQVPQRVRDLAREVTAGATTPGARAQAIEAFLTSDRFRYSLAATDATGDGLATIDDFLFRSRAGYCEQFAGAMAIMAREVGIPARMAVGFVPGTRPEGSDTWEVTARDLHTWPELWLDGYGWVAFEPTPTRGDAVTDPSATAAPTASPTPGSETVSPTPTAEATPTPTASDVPQPGDPGGAAATAAGWWVVVALLGLGSAVAALVAPRALRAHRRRTRLAATGDPRRDALAAWEEVRESVSDARLEWPAGSPRYAAEVLLGQLGDHGEAATALRALALASERAMFDRPEALATARSSWAEDVRTIVAALEGNRVS